jgi:hypothetical protein
MNLIQDNKNEVEGRKGILKIPLVRVGRWAHKAAKIIEFSISDLNQIIKNFKEDILQHKPYLTYGHVLEPYSADSHRKKGDLLDLSIENDVLYGYFKPNPSTYQSILDGDYEFASVEYVKEHIDPKTGDNVGMVLLRTALTNSPFLPGDIKIQALSQNPSSDRLFTTIPIKSKNMKENPNTQNLSNTATLEKEEQLEEVKEEVKEDTSSEVKIENTIEESKVSAESLILREILELKNEWKKSEELQKNLKEEIIKELEERLKIKEEEKDEPKVLSNKEDIKDIDDLSIKEIENKDTSDLSIKDKEEENKDEKIISNTPDMNSNKDPEISNTELKNIIGTNNLDIKGLVKSIRDRVSSAYTAQLLDSNSQVKSLQEQLLELKTQAEEERKQREVFALSLQEAQNQAFLASTDLTRDHLIGNGVPPELANDFIKVQTALLTNQSKINLSLDGQEGKDMDILEALSELFIRAISCNPINLSVSGQSSFSQGIYDPTGRSQRIRQTIERNKKRAQELYK